MADEGMERTAPDPTPVGEEPPQETPALWEDFIDIFTSPSDVFARRKGRSGWLILLLVTVVLGLLFFAWQQAFAPVMQAEMQRAIADAAQGPQMTAEQLDQMQSMGRLFGVIGFVVAFPVGVILAALVTWLMVKAFGGVATFGAMLMVVAYAQIVRIAGLVLGLVEAQFMDLDRLDSIHDVGFSLARFVDQPESGQLIVNLLSRVDLFTLWATALIAIGVAVVTRLSRSSAWAVALVVWLVASLPTIIGGIMAG